MSPITTHVLDTHLGKPASGVTVSLAIYDDCDWRDLGRGTTNEDGRITDLLADGELEIGIYQIRFDTGKYFKEAGVAAFFPEVRITFEIVAGMHHCHVPLLLSPFGYTTYRGS